MNLTRYQLQAYVFSDGEVMRFKDHGWATCGMIMINAPRETTHIIVKTHINYELWDKTAHGYTTMTTKPPPVAGVFDDVDQAIMAVVLGQSK